MFFWKLIHWCFQKRLWLFFAIILWKILAAKDNQLFYPHSVFLMKTKILTKILAYFLSHYCPREIGAHSSRLSFLSVLGFSGNLVVMIVTLCPQCRELDSWEHQIFNHENLLQLFFLSFLPSISQNYTCLINIFKQCCWVASETWKKFLWQAGSGSKHANHLDMLLPAAIVCQYSQKEVKLT